MISWTSNGRQYPQSLSNLLDECQKTKSIDLQYDRCSEPYLMLENAVILFGFLDIANVSH